MDQLTLLIRDEIKKQYKSIRQFGLAQRIPHATLMTIFQRGVGGTAYSTILKICQALNIQTVNYTNPYMIDETLMEGLDIYSQLDSRGKHTVQTVMRMEYERCLLKKSKKESKD